MLKVKTLMDILIRSDKEMEVLINGKSVDNINMSMKERTVNLQSEGGCKDEFNL